MENVTNIIDLKEETWFRYFRKQPEILTEVENKINSAGQLLGESIHEAAEWKM